MTSDNNDSALTDDAPKTIPDGVVSSTYVFYEFVEPMPRFLGWSFEEGPETKVTSKGKEFWPDIFIFVNPASSHKQVLHDLMKLDSFYTKHRSIDEDFTFLTIENERVVFLNGTLSIDSDWEAYLEPRGCLAEVDFYDAFPIEGHHIFVAYTDVCDASDLKAFIGDTVTVIERDGLFEGFHTSPFGYRQVFRTGGLTRTGSLLPAMLPPAITNLLRPEYSLDID